MGSLFAVLLTFTSEHEVFDLEPVMRAIVRLPSKVPFNQVMCIECRALTPLEAQSLQVKPPAMMFRIQRGKKPWIAYLERYKDGRGKEHHELRIIDGLRRAEETNGRWNSARKGADPIKFLKEKDLPIATIGDAH